MWVEADWVNLSKKGEEVVWPNLVAGISLAWVSKGVEDQTKKGWLRLYLDKLRLNEERETFLNWSIVL